MAVSPPPHLQTTTNDRPAAAGHQRDGVEASGAANEAPQRPQTAEENVSTSARFYDYSSADPTTAASPPFLLPSTHNHSPIAAGDLSDGNGEATGMAIQAVQEPPDTFRDLQSRTTTSADPTTAG